MSEVSSAVEDLNGLRMAYLRKLPEKLRRIRSLWHSLLYVKWDHSTFSLLHQLLHNLAGTSATYGLSEIGSLAATLDQRLHPMLKTNKVPDDRERSRISGRLRQLEEALVSSDSSEPLNDGVRLSLAPSALPSPHATKVLMLEDDADHASVVKSYLEQHGCEVRHVEDASALRAAIKENSPDLLLVDVMLPEFPTGGIQAVTDARQMLNQDTPVFFMSARGDLEARREAVRAGGSDYFVKPLNLGELARKIECLKEVAMTRYRVLVVDDDQDIAAYHASLLRNGGLIACELTNPFHILHMLKEFRPDLILMDLYMPECHGSELAQVIRQESSFSDIPILFLSGERDTARQNAALGKGGDAFLVKPVDDKELIEAVLSRVKRSRWLKRRLQYLGQEDLQTGLINQQVLLSGLEKTIDELSGTRSAAALLVIEIDRFKTVRDQLGLVSAGQLVTKVAGIIRREMSESEQVARLGDASFAVLMVGVSSESALAVSERLSQMIAGQLFRAGDQSVPLSISVGVAPFADSYRQGTEWLNAGAIACDIARRTDGISSHLHRPATDQRVEREQNALCAQWLKRALDANALFCIYQPIASLGGDEVERYDVLVRMNDPDGDEVLPARFLAAAEQEGLSSEIDRWVTRHAVNVLAQRHQAGNNTAFFVKLTSAVLNDHGFVAWLDEQLNTANLAGSALIFECSETFVSAETDKAAALFDELRRLGCGIALEHFGMRLGSVPLLSNLPIDYVKIDACFVHDLANNPANQDSIRQLLKPAEENDILVIASFVEDLASLNVLWQCGVQLIQGNFLQEPNSQLNFSFANLLD